MKELKQFCIDKQDFKKRYKKLKKKKKVSKKEALYIIALKELKKEIPVSLDVDIILLNDEPLYLISHLNELKVKNALVTNNYSKFAKSKILGENNEVL